MPDHPNDCAGKFSYATKAAALRIVKIRKMKARRGHHAKEQKRNVANLSAYRCSICHAFHIAGTRAPPKVMKKRRLK